MISKFKTVRRQRLAMPVKRFLHDRSGAITVDWIVLTGFLIFLGIAASFYVATSVPMVAEKVGSEMEEMTVMPD